MDNKDNKENLIERWLVLSGILKEGTNIDESIDTSDWQEELNNEFGFEYDTEEEDEDEK